MNRKFTDKELTIAVNTSDTYKAVCEKLSYQTGNYRILKKYIQRLQLDISHFATRSEIVRRARQNRKTMSHDDIFTINSTVDTGYVKRVVLKNDLIVYECNECSIKSWRDKNLTLHLDHINGVSNDHRLCNLRFLCPNCHSQTSTYCGRNITKTPKVKKRCVDCNKIIHQESLRCRPCNAKCMRDKNTKIDWPPDSILIQMIESGSYLSVAKKLQVSDNAVRKRLKIRGLL